MITGEPVFLLGRLLGELYPRPGFRLVHLHVRYRLRTEATLDATEYPPYRLVGQTFVRLPLEEGYFVLDLPSTIPPALPPFGPWGEQKP